MGGQVISIYEKPDVRFCQDAYNIYIKEIEQINKALIERNLPPYENDKIESSIPVYDDFALELRRSEAADFRLLAAKFIENPNWIPPKNPKDYEPISDTEYQKIWWKSHIAGMPDIHGYYVPVFFQRLSYPPSPILGSSITFQTELREMALKFNLGSSELDTYISNPRMPDYTRVEELKKEAFGKEKGFLLSLYAIATASLSYGRIIYLGE
jgi:hypothetical protein